jgi:hypothetical protein
MLGGRRAGTGPTQARQAESGISERAALDNLAGAVETFCEVAEVWLDTHLQLSAEFPADAGIDVGLDSSSGIRATLEAARAVAARWPGVPHQTRNLTDALGRLAEQVHACRQVLSGRADLTMEPDEEVFVGVDATNRGQVFGLLGSLDLDLVLTSDHEWCTYRELDGIAIHQLITGDDGDDAVTTARFVWTGAELLTDETATP